MGSPTGVATMQQRSETTRQQSLPQEALVAMIVVMHAARAGCCAFHLLKAAARTRHVTMMKMQ